MSEYAGPTSYHTKTRGKRRFCSWCGQEIAQGHRYGKWLWFDAGTRATIYAHEECVGAWDEAIIQEGETLYGQGDAERPGNQQERATAMTITLPLPDRRIRPNGRAHHMVKHRLTKRARGRARLATLALTLARRQAPPSYLGYSIAAYFPTARLWDEDNTLAACKAYLDGIADALGVDDRGWHLMGAPAIARQIDRANPRVEITFHPAHTPFPAT